MGLLWAWQQWPEYNFVLGLPNTWVGTFKDTVHHAQRIVRVETSNSVEPHMADNFRAGSDLAIDGNSSSVEVRRSRKPSRISRIFSNTAAPNASKTRDRDQHSCQAPFKRLVFWRSVYNSSCSRLM